jgi:3-hydroxyisobutyrate dehydrogenase-like beta-hydroxyacid dehydrogenase
VVFAGGEAAVLEAARPLLDPLAARVTHMGPSGSGQTTKLCNQLIVACNVLAIAETVALARRAGVDVQRLPEALQGGFADSGPLQVFGPRMARHAFEPRLGALNLMHKDVRLAVALAGEAGAQAPMLQLAEALSRQATAVTGVRPDGDLSQVVRLFEDELARA